MKNKRVKDKKIHKVAKPCRVLGMQVRSGVKAGAQWGDREFGSMRGGEFGRGGRLG